MLVRLAESGYACAHMSSSSYEAVPARWKAEVLAGLAIALLAGCSSESDSKATENATASSSSGNATTSPSGNGSETSASGTSSTSAGANGTGGSGSTAAGSTAAGFTTSGATTSAPTGSGNGTSGGGDETTGGNASNTGVGGAATTTLGSTSTSAATGGAGGVTSPSGGGGGTVEVPFILGADISSVQESNAVFVDTDDQTKSIFELLKNHGFNYIRLKTFVEPSAAYGYASTENGCAGLSEAYGDRDHVVEFGQQIKAAGMGFLLDFHYSDVWADPGNQIIPEAWRGAANIAELADYVREYTADVLTHAVDAGARPDMVQIGNEITPGMLMHVPGSNTDCWGNNPAAAPFGGSTSNWDDLSTLLKAGIAGVREVDPSIRIMLHVENTDDLDGVEWWVGSAIDHGVEFDVLGLSCYTAFQGQPSVWENTFASLAAQYPDLEFAIAEYNPSRTEANRIMKGLPDGRGLGTFFWEPTRSGEWGDSMFTWQGQTARANQEDFDEYDAMLPELGL